MEHRGLLENASADNDGLRAHLRHAVFIDERDPVVRVVARGERSGANVDARVASDPLH
ncbi:hypothetical protein D3C83_151300 [compost metagenome]